MKRLTAAACLAMAILAAGCATRQPVYRIAADRLTIRIDLPRAETVLFASSLDGYRLHDARRAGGGAWEIDLPAQREFAYFYKVNGKIYLPACRLTETDDFGSRNCLFLPGL